MERSRGWNWFGRFADVVAIVFAAVGAGALVWNTSITQAVMAASLALLTIASTVVAWRLTQELIRAQQGIASNQRLAGSLGKFSDAVDDFKRGYYSLNHEGQKPNTQQFVERCETACRTAAEAFSGLTGHKCRVVLKEMYVLEPSAGQQRAAVRTIALSDPAGQIEHSAVDWVDENEDFKRLGVLGEEYFLSGDLRIRRDACRASAGGYVLSETGGDQGGVN